MHYSDRVDISVYEYEDAEFNHSHLHLAPANLDILEKYCEDKNLKIFDMGCGNGSTANFLTNQGFRVSGVDPSVEGIHQAKSNFPHLNISLGSSSDDLLKKFGKFDLVYSLEVIEHVFDPFELVESMRSILNPGGYLILSTPYHGYWKNLALSIFNRWDVHFTPLWKGGHIKFWSPITLTRLLCESGFETIEIRRLGRIPIFAKSMILVSIKIE